MSGSNPFSLESKTILVTGASSGIGQRTAIECSKLGAHVIIVGRNRSRLDATFVQLEGCEHSQEILDLTDQERLNSLTSNLPVLDGVVLCAGKGKTLPFQFCTKDKYEDIFSINFFAPIELLRLLVKKKKINSNGSVVFVSSVGGVESFNVGNSIYGSSKAAINSSMKFCAVELAPKKIRVNSVNPGMVNTPLLQDVAISEEQNAINIQKYPLKRYGEPNDIAYGIIYLLSDAASWITGQSLIIDGGLTI